MIETPLLNNVIIQADFHSHLRQGAMMELCAPLVKKGGCDIVYVMPNLQPPITQLSHAKAYYKQLCRLAPDVKFLMTLFLHSGLTDAAIAEAAASKIIYGVRSLYLPIRSRSYNFSVSTSFAPSLTAMKPVDQALPCRGKCVPKNGRC